MESALSFIVTENVFVFLLVFTRFGAALTIMPGFGDFFTPMQIRLMFALALSFSLTSVFYQNFPAMPDSTIALVIVIAFEFIIGALIGVMARILMSALDTAGMIIGINTGLSNAQIFNPGAQTQGSLVGTFFYILGVVLIFATNLHHVLIYAVYESYEMIPPFTVPEFASIADLIARAVSSSFLVGFKLATPFIIIGLMLYTAMGIMGRLMPQVQVFILALPVQLLVGFITLSFVISATMIYWIRGFEEGLALFLSL